MPPSGNRIKRETEMNDYVSPDWAKAALLTIDIQSDFTLPGAPLEIPGTMEVLPRIQPLLQAFRNQQKPIIHVVRLYLPDGSNADLCRRKDIKQGKRMVVPGSDGAELMAELKPSPEVKLDAEKLLAGKLQLLGPQEWLMYKPRWGAFFQTPLESHLHNLAINTIVVCGCNFPNCPRTTIYEASERDFRIVLVTDAISQIYAQGLQELKNIGVSLLNSTECLAKTGARA